MLERVSPLRFTLGWLAAAVLLLPLSLLIWAPVAAVYFAPAALVSAGNPSEAVSAALGHIFLGTFAAAMGWCIGALQQLVTRRYLRIDLLRWREISLVGGFVAGVIASVTCSNICDFSDISLLWVRPSMRPAGGLLFSMLLFLGLLSAAQFLTLRRQVGASVLWVIAHLITVPMAYALWRNPLAAYFPYTESTVGIILTTPAVAALVTGAVMLHIVSHSTSRDKAKPKAAESHSAANASPESRADCDDGR